MRLEFGRNGRNGRNLVGMVGIWSDPLRSARNVWLRVKYCFRARSQVQVAEMYKKPMISVVRLQEFF